MKLIDRLINAYIQGSYLRLDGKTAGVQGESRMKTLRLHFSPEWLELTKKVLFMDAKGQNPVSILLSSEVSSYVAGTELVFDVPIPGEALAEEGECTFIVSGTAEDKQGYSVQGNLKVLPNDFYGVEPGNASTPTPTEMEQLQGHMDDILQQAGESTREAVTESKNAQAAAERAEREAAISEHNAAVWVNGGNLEPHEGEFLLQTGVDGAAFYAGKTEEYARNAERAKTTAEEQAAYAQDMAMRAHEGNEFAQRIVNEAIVSVDVASKTVVRHAEAAAMHAEIAYNSGEAAKVSAKEAAAARDAALAAESGVAADANAAKQAAAKAQTAQGEAEKAQTAAQTAKTAAETARNAAESAANRAESYTSHPPVPTEDGRFWRLWDGSKYVTTEYRAEGIDGFSPTVTIENVDVETGGTKVSITDKNGTKTFTVWNGLDGEDGAGTNRRIWYTNQSGSDLQLELTAISNLEGAVEASKDTVAVGDIVICKKDNAVLYVEVMTDTLVGFGYIYGYVNVVAGADGKDGQDGKDGADGFSPTVQFTYFTNPHTARLWITDKNGEKYTDIVSPEVSVTEIEGGHRITVKDVGGTKTFDVMDGAGGAGGTATGLTGEAIVAGDDLNSSKFKSFDGNIKMFYTPNDVGNIANTPEGLEASGVYFPMVISIMGAFTHCVQYLIANNEIVSASNNNFATLYDKQVWMRNLDAFYWTPWTKVFPASGGSGGGSVNSVNGVKPDEAGNVALKYDDLEGKYFGEETKETKLVPDTTYTSNGGISFIEGSYPLEEGVSYLVEWDGERYDCVGTPASVYGYDLIAVGNLALVGAGDDNGMPFAIGCVIADGSYAVTAATTGEHIFSIFGVVTELKRIDQKFLPEALQFGEESTVLLTETTMPYDEEAGGFVKEGMLGFVGDQTYIVNWNGTEYKSKALDASALLGMPAGSLVFVGNLSVVDPSFPDAGEPFAIMDSSAESMALIMPLDGTTELTISIDKVKIETIADKFLPKALRFGENADGTVTPIDKKYLPPDIGNGSSGGGGNIIADEVVPEMTVTVANGGAQIPAFIAIPDKTYYVTFDGTEYECVAQDQSNLASGYVSFGAITDYGIAGNGEPFGILLNPTVAAFVAANGSHTLRIVEAPVPKPAEIVVDIKRMDESITLPTSNTDNVSKVMFPDLKDMYSLLWGEKHGILVKLKFKVGGKDVYLSGGNVRYYGSDPAMRSYTFTYATFGATDGNHVYVFNLNVIMSSLSTDLYVYKLY